jgi:hypothetical protein
LASSASTGTIHTQWLSQLIGETSTPVTAQVTQPAVGRPARASRVAAARPRQAMTTAATSHSAVTEPAPSGVLVRSASRDWFSSEPRLWFVKFPACRKYPVSHHFTDSPGRTAKPMTTVTAKTPVATAAWRSFPARIR